MIETIPTLLTPLMLAMSPPAAPAYQPEYDWQSQRATMNADSTAADYQNATMRGSNSYVGQNLTVDDWNQD